MMIMKDFTITNVDIVVANITDATIITIVIMISSSIRLVQIELTRKIKIESEPRWFDLIFTS